MADRFGKSPINLRSGTSVKVDVNFKWFDGKNRDLPSDTTYPSYVSPSQQELDGKTYKSMKEYAKAYWAKYLNLNNHNKEE